jgi:putative membrane protein insertion efficiency factor
MALLTLETVLMGSIAIVSTSIILNMFTQPLHVVSACRTCILVSPLNPTFTLSLAPLPSGRGTLRSRPSIRTVADTAIPLNMFYLPEDEEKRSSSQHGKVLSNSTNSSDGKKFVIPPEGFAADNNNDKGGTTDASSAMLLGSIQFYKNFISPVLPRACRFLPTCSTYGMEAIQQYGPTKGVILTAWRILRCSPFGGRGYDPPVWPPVPYNYKSY